MSGPTLTEQLAHEAARLSGDELPDDVRHHVRRLVLDFCGNALGGADTESFSLAAGALSHVPDGRYGAVRSRGLALPEYAALLNGIAGHSLETDDIQNHSSIHIGVVVIPTVLATSEMTPTAGRAAVRAIVAGYETLGRIGRAVNPASHYARGFHPTSACGPFGAAMAASCVLGLTEAQTVNALGLASVGSAGLMQFVHDGSLIKRLHPGWAAHAGLTAAVLARAGYTGPRRILEGEHGFLRAYSDDADPSLAAGRWEPPGGEVLDTAIKPHATCRYNQSPIDGVLSLVREHNIAPEEIADIRIGILDVALAIIAEPLVEKRRPRSTVEAQFSLPFAAAVAALYGRAGVAEHAEETAARREVESMMDRVTPYHDPALDQMYPEKWPATVEIRTRQGETLRTLVEHPKGDPRNPLTWEETAAKFHGIAASVSEERRAEIVSVVRELEGLEDFAALARLLGDAG